MTFIMMLLHIITGSADCFQCVTPIPLLLEKFERQRSASQAKLKPIVADLLTCECPALSYLHCLLPFLLQGIKHHPAQLLDVVLLPSCVQESGVRERSTGTAEKVSREYTLTLAAVPAKAACHIGGLDGPFLAGLQEHKQPLQLIGDAGHRILLGLLKLPAEKWRDVDLATGKCNVQTLAETFKLLPPYL